MTAKVKGPKKTGNASVARAAAEIFDRLKSRLPEGLQTDMECQGAKITTTLMQSCTSMLEGRRNTALILLRSYVNHHDQNGIMPCPVTLGLFLYVAPENDAMKTMLEEDYALLHSLAKVHVPFWDGIDDKYGDTVRTARAVMLGRIQAEEAAAVAAKNAPKAATPAPTPAPAPAA